MGLLARNKSLHPFFGDSFFADDFFGGYLYRPTKSNVGRYPIRRLKTEDESIKLQFDVPGFDKNDIEIIYDEESNVLSVSSKIEEEAEGKNSTRTFSYQVTVYDIDTDTIEAQCDKGILTVTGQPTVKQLTRKRIEIK